MNNNNVRTLSQHCVTRRFGLSTITTAHRRVGSRTRTEERARSKEAARRRICPGTRWWVGVRDRVVVRPYNMYTLTNITTRYVPGKRRARSCVYVSVCVHARACVYMCKCVRACARLCVYVYVCVSIRVCLCECASNGIGGCII